MHPYRIVVAVGTILVLSTLTTAQQGPVATLQPPGQGEYCRMEPNGVSVLPSGRYVTPAGKTVRITADPFGLTLSRDGRFALGLHDRVLTVIDTQAPDAAVRHPSYDRKLPSPFGEGAFMGAQITPDNKLAYLSGGNDGTVIIFDLQAGRRIGVISLDGESGRRKYQDSFVGDLALSRDGRRLFVLDQFNFRLVVVDLEVKKVAASVGVGRFPFGLGISPDESYAYVANVGIFDYPLVPGVKRDGKDEKGIDFPPYGLPSKEAEQGTTVYGRQMPGLGSPHVPEAVSVWAVDLRSGEVTARLKTGYQMGQRLEGLEVVGGASPNSIAAGQDFVYVTNATNDTVAGIDAAAKTIVAHIPLIVDARIDGYRGLIPFGLALSPDQSRLYVALSGLNAAAVVDTRARKVAGYSPTGWCPTTVAVFPDGRRICVVTARGHGAGPNGGQGFTAPVQGTYVGDIMLGTLHIIDVPDEAGLAEYTRQVIRNTFVVVPVEDDDRNPLPPAPGLRKSPIKHVVYITKENRTYDEVLGQLAGGKGDPTLARYGRDASFRTVKKATVMPNHLKIAKEFAFSDNF